MLSNVSQQEIAHALGTTFGLRLDAEAARQAATPDLGHRLENAVFLSLRTRNERISYAGEKDSWECDFLTDTEAIQVCTTLNDENRDREVRGALRAAELPGRRRPLILTLDKRDRITADGVSLDVLPAWEWLAPRARRPSST